MLLIPDLCFEPNFENVNCIIQCEMSGIQKLSFHMTHKILKSGKILKNHTPSLIYHCLIFVLISKKHGLQAKAKCKGKMAAVALVSINLSIWLVSQIFYFNFCRHQDPQCNFLAVKLKNKELAQFWQLY